MSVVSRLLAWLQRWPLSRRIVAAMVLIAVCGLAAVVYHAARLRSEALTTHRSLASSIARVSEQQLTLLVKVIDRQLEVRSLEWQQLDESGLAGFQDRLQADLGGMPALRSLAVVSSDGRVLASSQHEALGRRLSAAAMTALAGGSDSVPLRISGLWAGRDLTDGAPTLGALDASTSPYFVTAARRIAAPDNSGYIVAVLNPDYFANVFTSLLARPGFLVALSRYDGLLLASTDPVGASPGRNQASSPLFAQHLPLREIGLYESAALEPGGPAILAYHASRLYPLVVQVRFPHRAVLAEWRSEMYVLAIASLVLAAVLGLFGVLAYRVQLRREREGDAAKQAVELAARVFDVAFDGILITDAEQKIVRVNRAFTEVTGFAEADVIGRTPHVLSSGLHDEAFYREIWDAVEHRGQWLGEITNRRSNGELYQEQLGISVVKDAAGKVCNYIGTFTDITDRKRNEHALRTAKEAAEAANLAKSRFLATMSHEIRTPMNGILGMAHLLLEPALSEAERHEYARTVLSSGETLMTLLNDILDLSRVEAGRLDLNPVGFLPAVLLDEAAALFVEAAQRKGLAIQTRWAGAADDCFRADPIRLRQMLANLISNAIKFSNQGVIRVVGEVERADGARVDLRFTVIDNGIGVPPEHLNSLFQPFSQLDTSPTRAAGGSGLGLSIVRSLALLMDGDVGVRNEAGQGASFWFRVRAERALDCAPQQGRLSADPVSAAPLRADASSLHILVVEDSPTNAKVIETMLQRRGYRVSMVENGLRAVEAIAADTSFDLVLMDCEMPVLDGISATRRIREREQAAGLASVPIIALTANAFEEHRHKCFEAGMNDFLVKPIVLSALNAALERWLPARGRGEHVV
ncbi:ATP-binding protein [Niveibacterium sp. 24ML]|uniref:ATP-binding protein n=1 Tax=Niveibacterium sp. 24ML TaxID=2985512 RepID=UPI00226F7DB5|nr:ATP-binding protein [Niveibacterium sp. 24ML]MCX9155477.1 ATP-binding protein [Niveibacterium sp. 24ML]